MPCGQRWPRPCSYSAQEYHARPHNRKLLAPLVPGLGGSSGSNTTSGNSTSPSSGKAGGKASSDVVTTSIAYGTRVVACKEWDPDTASWDFPDKPTEYSEWGVEVGCRGGVSGWGVGVGCRGGVSGWGVGVVCKGSDGWAGPSSQATAGRQRLCSTPPPCLSDAPPACPSLLHPPPRPPAQRPRAAPPLRLTRSRAWPPSSAPTPRPQAPRSGPRCKRAAPTRRPPWPQSSPQTAATSRRRVMRTALPSTQ